MLEPLECRACGQGFSVPPELEPPDTGMCHPCAEEYAWLLQEGVKQLYDAEGMERFDAWKNLKETLALKWAKVHA